MLDNIIINHLITGLIFGTSISIISWIVGMIVNAILLKTEYYEKLTHLNFITDERINKKMGIDQFKWMVKNTFFKYFNQSLKVENKKTDLVEIRKQMTLAEVSHLIGFVFVLFFVVYYSIVNSLIFGAMILLANTLLNLYPSLLQQENKRRIDKFIQRQADLRL